MNPFSPSPVHQMFHVNRFAVFLREMFHVNPFLDPGAPPIVTEILRGLRQGERYRRRLRWVSLVTFVSSSQSSAVLLLQQATRPMSSGEPSPIASGASLVAAANGVELPSDKDGAGAASRANGKISEALFKPNVPNAIEMKLHLMKRLGEEFGIKLEAHESHASFGRAIEAEINKIKMKPEGALILSAIEKKLGFDKLGFSLDAFVNAIIDPKGADGQKVDAAIKDHLNLDDEGQDKAEEARAALEALRIDDAGLYGFVNA